MAGFLMLAASPIAAITGPRGTGASNLLSPSPREAWFATANDPVLQIDFGQVITLDTIFLGFVYNALPTTTWSITYGAAGYYEGNLLGQVPLRVPDSAGLFAVSSHALWTGPAVQARYIQINFRQPDGAAALIAGVLMAGAGIHPGLGQEWGAGGGVRDLGSGTRLPSGDLAVVDGAKIGVYGCTLGDLSQAEALRLRLLQRRVGETRPVLLVEDTAATAGLFDRIHYGNLTGLKRFERRNVTQTRWDLTMEEWLGALPIDSTGAPAPVVGGGASGGDGGLSYSGTPLVFGG